jgi:hypothetical protein
MQANASERLFSDAGIGHFKLKCIFVKDNAPSATCQARAFSYGRLASWGGNGRLARIVPRSTVAAGHRKMSGLSSLPRINVIEGELS